MAARFPACAISISGRFLQMNLCRSSPDKVDCCPALRQTARSSFSPQSQSLIGLRWSDIDFEAGTLTVQNTVTRMKTLIEHEQTKSAASKRRKSPGEQRRVRETGSGFSESRESEYYPGYLHAHRHQGQAADRIFHGTGTENRKMMARVRRNVRSVMPAPDIKNSNRSKSYEKGPNPFRFGPFLVGDYWTQTDDHLLITVSLFDYCPNMLAYLLRSSSGTFNAFIAASIGRPSVSIKFLMLDKVPSVRPSARPSRTPSLRAASAIW